MEPSQSSNVFFFAWTFRYENYSLLLFNADAQIQKPLAENIFFSETLGEQMRKKKYSKEHIGNDKAQK